MPSLLDYYTSPSQDYIEPFCILNNLYYVGDKRVCSHLIDTGEGLILFDAGYQHTIHLLIQSIWEAGFNPKDIKYLILSHGHFDHFGACNEFRALYGCKTFMSKADCDMLRKTPEASLLAMSPNPYAKLPMIDCEFEDVDIYSKRILEVLGLRGAIRVSPLHCHGMDDIDKFLYITAEIAQNTKTALHLSGSTQSKDIGA